MKIFLIILNVVLGALVVQQTVSLLKPAKEELTLSTKDKDKAKPKIEPRTAEPETTLSTAEAARVVTEQNIFNLDRCPEAASGGRGFQMSLIGVYDVGTEQGAIIEQSRQSTRRNVFREMESMVRGGRGGRGTGDTTTTLLPIKKYFRVGETLENGYTLSSVGTDYAILTRGSSSTRLELQLAGRNVNQRSGGTRPQPNQQQVQQMMMMGQLRMMQMMQQQIQQGGGNRAGGTTSNRPRTTR